MEPSVTAIALKRTNSADPAFIDLVTELDADLAIRDGDDHAFYHQFNKTHDMNTCVVALLNGAPAAIGAFKPFTEQTVEIKRMYVRPQYRRQGLAAAVLAELERWAAELGHTACVLETGKNQPEAIALYQKNGYNIIPNYGQYAGIENSVCMQKRIGRELN